MTAGQEPTGEAIGTVLAEAGFSPSLFQVTDHSHLVKGGGFVTVTLTAPGDEGLRLRIADTIEAAGYWAWLDTPGVSVIAWDEDVHGKHLGGKTHT